MTGKLLIISGPSGTGKTTIVHHLLSSVPDLRFSTSATTRTKRENEKEGTDYYFISESEFRKKIKEDEFAEWEEVYPGMFYGTLKKEIERIWALGKTVVFDVDVIGALNLKKKFNKNSLAIFIMPPSLEDLEKRLRLRKTETAKSLQRRIGKADEECKLAVFFDKILVNESLLTSFAEAESLVINFLKK